MSAPIVAERVIVVAGASPDVRVSVWPLRDAPLPVGGILAAAGLASVAAGAIVASWLVGLFTLAALAVALWRLWARVDYRLYELGISQTAFGRTWRIPWHWAVVYRVCHSGVLLQADDDESALSRLKGLYIPWGDQREEVLAALGHYLPDEQEEPQGADNSEEV